MQRQRRILSRVSESAGIRFGKYVRGDRLGAGGMGEVWKAWDSELNRWVALKFLKGASDSDEIARFRREAQLAARLGHPNIAAIYAFEAGDKPYLAMQFVDGRTLRAPGAAGTRTVVAQLRDAAIAVDYAHGQGIIHRDLKPENLMVTASGHVFVMDFGLARPVQSDSRLTASGLVVGTPAYMPPEQARGETADARADVYALGATLYELLTHRAPFAGASVFDVLRKVIDEDPARPRSIEAGIDPELETIVLKCLEKDRERRYASARGLADDLGRWLAGEPISARAPTVGYRMRKWVARRRAMAAVVVIAVLAFVVFAGALMWRQAGERRTNQSREAAQRVYEEAKRDLHALRLRSYRPGWHLTDAEFAEFDRLAARCREQMKAAGESGDGWWVVGRVHHVLGNDAEARECYERGRAAEPGHVACTLFLGQLIIERALCERYRTAERWKRKSLEQRAGEGLRLVEEAVRRGGLPEIERDLAEGYARAIRGDASAYAEQMLAKHAGRDFCEEFQLIAGLAAPRELVERAGKAIAARASYAEAWFWRTVGRDGRFEFSEALKDLDEALRINPRYREAYISRAMVRQALRDADGALADCDTLLRLSPRLAVGYVNRGVVRTNRGELQEAIRDYDAALAIDPDLVEAICNRGAVRVKLGDLEGAGREYEEALKRRPGFPSALYNRAFLKVERGDLDGALRDYTAALEGDAEFFEAHVDRGEILLKRGEHDAALRDFEEAIRLNPNYARAYAKRGAAWELKKEMQKAIRDYDAALKLDPTNADAAFGRGNAWSALGRRDYAFRDFSLAIELNPSFAEARVNRAGIFIERGEFESALKDCAEALRARPGLTEARIAAANAHCAAGHPAKALVELDAAVATDARCARALTNRCTLKQEMGDLDGALADGNAAVAADPGLASAWVNRGSVFLARGDIDAAFADFTQATKVDAACAVAWMNRGNVLAAKGDFKAAEKEYSKAIDINPSYGHAYYNRASARHLLGARDEAMADVDLAIRHLPKFSKSYHLRAMLRTARKDPDGALEDYATAIRLDPAPPEPYVNRAVILAARGDLAGAQADLEQALARAPESWAPRENVQAMLDQVKAKREKPRE